MLIGVNKTKNNIPKTIGFTTIPNKNPNRIHDLFNGKSNPGFIKLTTINDTDNIRKKKLVMVLFPIKKNELKIINIKAKNSPNF